MEKWKLFVHYQLLCWYCSIFSDFMNWGSDKMCQNGNKQRFFCNLCENTSLHFSEFLCIICQLRAFTLVV